VKYNKKIYAKLYPNPNNGEGAILEYDFGSDEKVGIQMFELSGRMIYETNNLQGRNNKIPLDTSPLKSGFYLVKVFSSSKSQTVKLIINQN
jgi:hypothetical protein